MTKTFDGKQRLRILLTEGSSTSARHSIYALARFRPLLDVCDPNNSFCLARASTCVRRCFRCPPFADDPAAYLRALLQRLRAKPYDVLFPAHDQTFLLSRFREEFASRVGLAVPEFEAMEQVQSKIRFARLLAELDIPHPRFDIARSAVDLKAFAAPCYVKLPYSTAGRGVWLVRDEQEMAKLALTLQEDGRLGGSREILVQQPALGDLCVVQSVFQAGRLVAAHCYQSRVPGVGGSAGARVGVSHPAVIEHLRRLGAHLRWHGALMLDYLHDEVSGPAFIEANPRIGETMNATLSGVNLCAVLVDVSLGNTVQSLPPSRPGVRTHGLINLLLALGQSGVGKEQIRGELKRALTGQGLYEGSEEELTRPSEDLASLVPAAVVIAKLLRDPHSADRFVERAVNHYSLSETAAEVIRSMPFPASKADRGSPLKFGMSTREPAVRRSEDVSGESFHPSVEALQSV